MKPSRFACHRHFRRHRRVCRRRPAFRSPASFSAFSRRSSLFSLKMANNWDRFVILRAGKLSSVKGPGLFMIIPMIDAITAIIDERIQTTQFNAEQALTRDTVPVNVDAVVFWHVHDAQSAALNITDYRSAIDRVAQTSLRETIGSSHLTELLSERKQADEVLAPKSRKNSDLGDLGQFGRDPRRRHPGRPAGRHVAAGAGRAREGSARDPGSREAAIAQKFVDAANTYASNAAAMHLRAMNIIYETTKERGATILMPTSMVDSMSVALPAAMLARDGPCGGRPARLQHGARLIPAEAWRPYPRSRRGALTVQRRRQPECERRHRRRRPDRGRFVPRRYDRQDWRQTINR